MKRHIIPIFVPHYGCPHQCVFCNQKKITGVHTTMNEAQARSIIDEAFRWQTRASEKEVAFYGGSFTAIPMEKQRELLKVVSPLRREGKVAALRLSTRPDAINEEILRSLEEHLVTTIELGVQSMDDAVLAQAERGHTAKDVIEAVAKIRKYSFRLGLQIMPGLPGEDVHSMIRTAIAIRALKPDFVRIYPTVVISDTPLAESYRKGEYRPLTLVEAVKRTAFLKLFFARAGIPVIRMGLQATEEMDTAGTVLAGPYHAAFGELVEAELFRQMMVAVLEQESVKDRPIVIHHHASDTSKVRGQKKSTIRYLREAYGMQSIDCVADGLRQGEIGIEIEGDLRVINFSMMDTI